MQKRQKYQSVLYKFAIKNLRLDLGGSGPLKVINIRRTRHLSGHAVRVATLRSNTSTPRSPGIPKPHTTPGRRRRHSPATNVFFLYFIPFIPLQVAVGPNFF